MKEKHLTLKSDMTLASLLKKSPILLAGRLEILVLLSLLYGILSGIITYPVTSAFKPAFRDPDANLQAIMETLGLQLPLSILLSLLINAILLVPITRLLVDEEPFKGGLNKYLYRVSGIFTLQISAIFVFFIILFLMSIVLGLFSAILPQSFILIITVAAIFILLLCLYAVMNVAIVGKAIDSPTSLLTAWNMIKPIILPLAAAYGIIKIIATILSMLVSGILMALFSGFELAWLPSIIDQSFGFAGQILHFSACLWATQAIMNKRDPNAEE